MVEATVPLKLPNVTDETGRQVRDRRLRMGMSVRQLAEEAGVDRGRLAALESGEEVRDTTLAKVLSTLSRLEQEMGMDDLSAEEREGVVEFRVAGNFGVDVVVRGPVRDLEALEASVNRILSRMQSERPEN